MDYKRLSESNYRFMSIIWENEPLTSAELVKACEERLGWNKSTTYTILKRLIDRGLLKNDHSVVTSLADRDEVCASECDRFVEQTFGGSLPGFLVAFLGGKKISREEAEELKKLIDSHT